MQVLCRCPSDSPQLQAHRGGEWRQGEQSSSTTFTLTDSVSAHEIGLSLRQVANQDSDRPYFKDYSQRTPGL